MIRLKMGNLLGLGGGGVIIHRYISVKGIKRDCAIKLVPLRQEKIYRNLSQISNNSVVMSTQRADNMIRPKEVYPIALEHPNIIKYLHHGYQDITGELHYFAGTINLRQNLSCDISLKASKDYLSRF